MTSTTDLLILEADQRRRAQARVAETKRAAEAAEAAHTAALDAMARLRERFGGWVPDELWQPAMAAIDATERDATVAEAEAGHARAALEDARAATLDVIGMVPFAARHADQWGDDPARRGD